MMSDGVAHTANWSLDTFGNEYEVILSVCLCTCRTKSCWSLEESSLGEGNINLLASIIKNNG